MADMESESYATADTPVPGLGGIPKGKGKGKLTHKGKGKSKSKGKGKSKDKGKTHATLSPWKGSGKGKGKIRFKESRKWSTAPNRQLQHDKHSTRGGSIISAYSLPLLP